MRRWFASLLIVLSLIPLTVTAQEKATDKSIAARTAGWQKLDGFIPLYYDAANGKMWMEIARFNEEFLMQSSLPAGVGSNDIGLDRGQPGNGRIVYFERNGGKVFLVQPNYRYRALGNDCGGTQSGARLVRAIRFVGLQGRSEQKATRVLVDATEFLLARCPRRQRNDAADAAGEFSDGRNALGVLSAAHEILPEKYRSRSPRRRRPWPLSCRSHAHRAGRDRARTSFHVELPDKTTNRACPLDPRALASSAFRFTTRRRSPNLSKSVGLRAIACRKKTPVFAAISDPVKPISSIT
ncbi:MAG: hypothetical protein U0Y68_23360 [Blastocatellia bacterium]